MLRTLTKDSGTNFRTCTDSAENTFGLFNHDVTQIKPNYEAMLKGGHLKMTEMGVQPGESNCVKKIHHLDENN